MQVGKFSFGKDHDHSFLRGGFLMRKCNAGLITTTTCFFGFPYLVDSLLLFYLSLLGKVGFERETDTCLLLYAIAMLNFWISIWCGLVPVWSLPGFHLLIIWVTHCFWVWFIKQKIKIKTKTVKLFVCCGMGCDI